MVQSKDDYEVVPLLKPQHMTIKKAQTILKKKGLVMLDANHFYSATYDAAVPNITEVVKCLPCFVSDNAGHILEADMSWAGAIVGRGYASSRITDRNFGGLIGMRKKRVVK